MYQKAAEFYANRAYFFTFRVFSVWWCQYNSSGRRGVQAIRRLVEGGIP